MIHHFESGSPEVVLPVWEAHDVAVETRIVSPGVVRDTVRKLACLPEGWLQ
jgi:hypothetical protein